MKIIKVTYRIKHVGDVYVCHHYENGKVAETLLKSCKTEDDAFRLIHDILRG